MRYRANNALTGPLCLVVLFAIIVFMLYPDFFSLPNLRVVLFQTCLLVPVVLGVYLLLVMGQFDLSVGSVAALSGIVTASFLRMGIHPAVCVLIALATGMLVGTANWILVVFTRVPAIVGTLITMSAATAGALAFSDARVLAIPAGQFVETIASCTIALGIALVSLLEFFARRHVFVRHMHLAGSSRNALANAGINVRALDFAGFVAAAMGAAIVGILQAARTASASPILFQELPLECIAAGVIGGARFAGGIGTPMGAFLGLLVVVMSRNLVIIAGVQAHWQALCVAMLMLAAAMINRPPADPVLPTGAH